MNSNAGPRPAAEPIFRWATHSDLIDPELTRAFDAMRHIHDEVAVAHDWVGESAYPWPKRPLYEWSRRTEYPFVVRELERHKENLRAETENGAANFSGGGKLRILDAGSGVTFLPFHLERALAARVDCLDRDPSHGARLDKLAALLNLPAPHFIAGDLAAALPVETGFYDAVLCVSVLEHLPDDRRLAAAAEIWRALRPGGLLLLTLDVSLTGEEDGLALFDVPKFIKKLGVIAGMPLPSPSHLAPNALTTLRPGHGAKPLRVGNSVLDAGPRARALRYLNRPLPTLGPLACLMIALPKPAKPNATAPPGEARP